MKIISVCNQKGGVGKTTTTLNLGSALRAHGQRVLLVDADQQRNLTTSLLPNGVSKQTLSELLHYTVAGLPCLPTTFIHKASDVDVIAASKLLAAANSILGTSNNSESILEQALQAVTENGTAYDYVLIDCAPSLDLLVTNALTASDGVVIPTEPATYSVDGIVGVWETITRIQRTGNPTLKVDQIVINKYDGRRKDDRRNVEVIKEAFGDRVFPTPIPMWSEIKNSAESAGREAMTNRKSSRAWEIYMNLAEVIINEHQS